MKLMCFVPGEEKTRGEGYGNGKGGGKSKKQKEKGEKSDITDD